MCTKVSVKLEIIGRGYSAVSANNFMETDEFGTEYFGWHRKGNAFLTLIDSSPLLSTPSNTCFTPDSKQSSMTNVVNTDNEQYLETDLF